jgi:hypothetical protein
MKAAGYIDDSGIPTALARSQAEKLIRADQLANQTVKDGMLQKDPGSTLTDWYKMSTPRLTTSGGVPYEVHFYENINDGTLYLDRDYYLVFKKVF